MIVYLFNIIENHCLVSYFCFDYIFSEYFRPYLLKTHFLKFYVSLKRYFIDLQFKTIIIKRRPLNYTQLARQGPAFTVMPVLIPT